MKNWLPLVRPCRSPWRPCTGRRSAPPPVARSRTRSRARRCRAPRSRPRFSCVCGSPAWITKPARTRWNVMPVVEAAAGQGDEVGGRDRRRRRRTAPSRTRPPTAPPTFTVADAASSRVAWAEADVGASVGHGGGWASASDPLPQAASAQPPGGPTSTRAGRSSAVALEQATGVADRHRPAVEQRVVEPPKVEAGPLARLHVGLELLDHVPPEQVRQLVGRGARCIA